MRVGLVANAVLMRRRERMRWLTSVVQRAFARSNRVGPWDRHEAGHEGGGGGAED